MREGIVTHARTQHRRRILALAVCGLLAASIPVGTGVAAPVAAGNSCVDGWQAMPVEASLDLGTPTGSASIAGQPTWFAGRTNSMATTARWDGTTWRRVSTPWTTDAGLTGISALSSSAAWTVGFSNAASPRPISAKWNGSSWTAITVPHPGGRTASLTDVAAISARKSFAVGLRLVSGSLLPLAMTRTKTAWVNHSPLFGTGREGGLTAVTRATDGNMWAVGWRTDAGRPRPWAGFWNGSTWTATPLADVSAGLAYLTDVEFMSADHGFAVGYIERDGGGHAPILERWDGAVWQAEAVPWPAQDSVVLTTVSVDAAGSVIVGGQQMTDAGPSAVMAIRVGGTWQLSVPRNDPYPGSWTQNATGLASGAFVVGHFGPSIQAFITCDSGSTGTRPPPTVKPHPSRPYRADEEDVVGERPDSGGSAETAPTAALEGFEARDVTAAAGVTLTSMTYSGVAADFNADEWPDLFVNRHGDAVPLFALGGESGFTVVATNFQYTDRHLCAAADATGDGQLDLFCSVGRRQGTAMGAHEFAVNVGETGGTLVGEQFGLLDITGRGRAAAFVQLATDLLPSLFVANEPVRIDGLPSLNRFFRNVDGTHFVGAPEMGLDRSAGGQCALAANLDADADEELLMCTTEPTDGVAAGTRLYDFDGTSFVDRTRQLGLGKFAALDVEVADFDANGTLDIAELRANQVRVSLAGTNGFAKVFELVTSGAVAMAVGDVNGDQRPDVYIARQPGGNGNHLMLVNGGNGGSFTSVAIPQPGSGTADDVLAVDYDRNGLTDFLVLNGRFGPGPVKLTAFFSEGE